MECEMDYTAVSENATVCFFCGGDLRHGKSEEDTYMTFHTNCLNSRFLSDRCSECSRIGELCGMKFMVLSLQQKVMQLTQELECQRINSQAAKDAMEQRLQEKQNALEIAVKQRTQALSAMGKESKELKNKYQEDVVQASKKLDVVNMQSQKSKLSKEQIGKDTEGLELQINSNKLILQLKDELRYLHKQDTTAESAVKELQSEKIELEKNCAILQHEKRKTSEVRALKVQMNSSSNLVKEKEIQIMSKEQDCAANTNTYLQEVNQKWQEVQQVTAERATQLGSTHEVQCFQKDVDETKDWICEKDGTLNPDICRDDLRSVQTLQHKHEGLERDLAALGDREVNQKWQEVQQVTAKRATQLGSAHEVQCFQQDVDETKDWICEKDGTLNPDICGNDLRSVQTLQHKHEGLERNLAALGDRDSFSDTEGDHDIKEERILLSNGLICSSWDQVYDFYSELFKNNENLQMPQLGVGFCDPRTTQHRKFFSIEEFSEFNTDPNCDTDPNCEKIKQHV